MDTFEISWISLVREGVDINSKACVYVKLKDGREIKVIEEMLDGFFSHCIHPSGLRSLSERE